MEFASTQQAVISAFARPATLDTTATKTSTSAYQCHARTAPLASTKSTTSSANALSASKEKIATSTSTNALQIPAQKDRVALIKLPIILAFAFLE